MALAGTVVWTTLAMVFVYALILRVVSPARLRRVLGYLQLVMTMAIFLPIMLDDTLGSMVMNMGDPRRRCWRSPRPGSPTSFLLPGEGGASPVLWP